MSLAPLTTLRLGGPARRLVRVATADELVATVRELDAAGEPVLLLAGGSNVVVSDAGFDGTVVRIETRGIERDGATLTVESGEEWDAVVRHAVRGGLAGVECLSGIPGSTGATPIQNVGAYGQDVSQTIASVRVLDRRSGEVADLPPGACGFAYRSSAFKGRADHVVLGVTFALRESDQGEPVAYAELARALGVELGDRAPLGDVREAVLALRRAKGMVIDAADPDSVSAGSFFTNPILDAEAFAQLRRRAAPQSPPAFPEPDGRIKTSAAWLIQRAGFERGMVRGRAAISSKHTLALVNRGGASAADLVALAREIAGGVRDAFGVVLVPEPAFVGHEW
ncbi:UDP-N-acetylmuramate dehydrogenase [Capillimicrobium parvum]|uniref:UDP-N-acetylmuramate dehydrogenase n=1 Tax=Capillimicrobium parvum TaxID=2884022 RepID=UPI00216B2A86|nr:UDP-N-acetylmuramate dehydrogenase [Capillimicrobium parvum]